MKIVGKDGFKALGVELPVGTLVKWEELKHWYDQALGTWCMSYSVRHTEEPLPRDLWDRVPKSETSAFAYTEVPETDEARVFRFVTTHLGAP